ncbi:MAG: hypothetical protein GEU76_14050 [Alphaproteobacteria bacterium]|nr:hypothetical protein [Alphaproteobacteria bacterium]
MASAIRTLAKVLDRDPCQIPLYAPSYRQLITEASPGAIVLSASRWRNVRSDVNRAIRRSGLSVATPRALLPLTCEWETLVERLSTRTDRHLVRRFGRFCSGLQRQPDNVEGTLVDSYLEDLRLKQLARDPEQSVRAILRVWNGKIAGALLPSAH